MNEIVGDHVIIGPLLMKSFAFDVLTGKVEVQKACSSGEK
jgi:hypothetical protein